jgi:hypothetical protein
MCVSDFEITNNGNALSADIKNLSNKLVKLTNLSENERVRRTVISDLAVLFYVRFWIFFSFMFVTSFD